MCFSLAKVLGYIIVAYLFVDTAACASSHFTSYSMYYCCVLVCEHRVWFIMLIRIVLRVIVAACFCVLAACDSYHTPCVIYCCVFVWKYVIHVAWFFGGGLSRTKDIFASVGADGSVRMFDLRSLEHSTIIYETHDLTPLMRLSWNKQDPNYLATILTDSAKTVILDIR